MRSCLCLRILQHSIVQKLNIVLVLQDDTNEDAIVASAVVQEDTNEEAIVASAVAAQCDASAGHESRQSLFSMQCTPTVADPLPRAHDHAPESNTHGQHLCPPVT